MNPAGRSDEDLLGQFFGQVMLDSREHEAESVNCIKVPVE